MKRLRKWFTQSNLIIVVAIICLGAVGVALYASQSQSHAADQSTILIQRSRISTLLEQNGKLASAIAKANTKLQANGITPVTVPAAEPGATGQAGQAGRDGRGIAFTLCTALGWEVTYTDGTSENAGTCVGQPGATGAAGAVGKAGSDGAPGTAGQDGTDGTNGADGQPGATGATGATGTGVSSVACVTEDDGTTAFRFTLTDGTTQDVAGSCTPPTPPPSDTATPAP